MDVFATLVQLGDVAFQIVAFLIVLSVVVFVHEMGHYLVGRWCGIGAEVFSVGFGTPLFAWTDKRGTRWQVAALPLGGYVKFLGDDDPASAGPGHDQGLTAEERAHAFHHASLGARALTVLAGPVANFLLSIVIFAGLVLAQGQPSEEPVIAAVQEEGADTGFMASDRVLSVGGEPVEDFADITRLLNRSNGASIPATVERDGVRQDIEVSYLAGARIGVVYPGMPAAQAGMKPGDKVVGLAGKPVTSFFDLQMIGMEIQAGETIEVEVMREGERVAFDLDPILRERVNPETGEREQLPTLGISQADGVPFRPSFDWVDPATALWRGVQQTYNIIAATLTFIGDMIFTNADTSGLGGPIGIAQMSGEQAKEGPDALIGLIALISTSIGLINLFPIPILDGGHLMFYAVEAVRGRPITEAWMRIGNMIGLSLVLFLMVFATYNDLARL